MVDTKLGGRECWTGSCDGDKLVDTVTTKNSIVLLAEYRERKKPRRLCQGKLFIQPFSGGSMNCHSGALSLFRTLTPSFHLVNALKIFRTGDGIYNLQLEYEIAERCLDTANALKDLTVIYLTARGDQKHNRHHGNRY